MSYNDKYNLYRESVESTILSDTIDVTEPYNVMSPDATHNLKSSDSRNETMNETRNDSRTSTWNPSDSDYSDYSDSDYSDYSDNYSDSDYASFPITIMPLPNNFNPNLSNISNGVMDFYTLNRFKSLAGIYQTSMNHIPLLDPMYHNHLMNPMYRSCRVYASPEDTMYLNAIVRNHNGMQDLLRTLLDDVKRLLHIDYKSSSTIHISISDFDLSHSCRFKRDLCHHKQTMLHTISYVNDIYNAVVRYLKRNPSIKTEDDQRIMEIINFNWHQFIKNYLPMVPTKEDETFYKKFGRHEQLNYPYATGNNKWVALGGGNETPILANTVETATDVINRIKGFLTGIDTADQYLTNPWDTAPLSRLNDSKRDSLITPQQANIEDTIMRQADAGKDGLRSLGIDIGGPKTTTGPIDPADLFDPVNQVKEMGSGMGNDPKTWKDPEFKMHHKKLDGGIERDVSSLYNMIDNRSIDYNLSQIDRARQSFQKYIDYDYSDLTEDNFEFLKSDLFETQIAQNAQTLKDIEKLEEKKKLMVRISSIIIRAGELFYYADKAREIATIIDLESSFIKPTGQSLEEILGNVINRLDSPNVPVKIKDEGSQKILTELFNIKNETKKEVLLKIAIEYGLGSQGFNTQVSIQDIDGKYDIKKIKNKKGQKTSTDMPINNTSIKISSKERDSDPKSTIWYDYEKTIIVGWKEFIAIVNYYKSTLKLPTIRLILIEEARARERLKTEFEIDAPELDKILSGVDKWFIQQIKIIPTVKGKGESTLDPFLIMKNTITKTDKTISEKNAKLSTINELIDFKESSSMTELINENITLIQKTFDLQLGDLNKELSIDDILYNSKSNDITSDDFLKNQYGGEMTLGLDNLLANTDNFTGNYMEIIDSIFPAIQTVEDHKQSISQIDELQRDMANLKKDVIEHNNLLLSILKSIKSGFPVLRYIRIGLIDAVEENIRTVMTKTSDLRISLTKTLQLIKRIRQISGDDPIIDISLDIDKSGLIDPDKARSFVPMMLLYFLIICLDNNKIDSGICMKSRRKYNKDNKDKPL
jgi:hypothetical protein